MKVSSQAFCLLIVCIILLSIAMAGCTAPLNFASSAQAPVATPASVQVVTAPPMAAAAAACPAGFSDCNGACRDITADIINCGGCGNSCPADSICKDSECLCKEGFAACNGKCQDVSADTSNCGSCKNQCSVGEKCISGICTPPGGSTSTSGQVSGSATCPTGLSVCGEWCVDLTSDAKNCAACGNACPNGMVCSGSQCAAASTGCSGGLTACNGNCANLQTDNSNCGSCGTICSGTKTCSSGTCSAPLSSPSAKMCRFPAKNCNGSCVDTSTDVDNCGSCGTKCSSGYTCESGVCKSPFTKINKLITP